MMMFGQIPRNMADILIYPSSTSVENVSEFVKRLQGLVTSAVTSIDQANKTAEGYANRSRRDFQFGVGDAVLLSTKYFIPEAFRKKKRKLAVKFSGPYEIIEVISPVTYRLQIPVGTKSNDVLHASMLKPSMVMQILSVRLCRRGLWSCKMVKKSLKWNLSSVTGVSAVSLSTW
jgi:hypothetical protein